MNYHFSEVIRLISVGFTWLINWGICLLYSFIIGYLKTAPTWIVYIVYISHLAWLKNDAIVLSFWYGHPFFSRRIKLFSQRVSHPLTMPFCTTCSNKGLSLHGSHAGNCVQWIFNIDYGITMGHCWNMHTSLTHLPFGPLFLSVDIQTHLRDGHLKHFLCSRPFKSSQNILLASCMIGILRFAF